MVTGECSYAALVQWPLCFLQAVHVDIADASGGVGDDSDGRRQMNDRLPDAAVNLNVVIAGGIAAQVELHLADAHVHFDAAQIHRAEVQVRLRPRPDGSQVDRQFVVKWRFHL